MTIKSDFDDGPLNDFGVMVTRIPVTMTTDSEGQKTYSTTASEEIKVVFMGTKPKFKMDNSGQTEVCDAKIFIKSDQTMNKYDKIFHKNREYIVDKVNKRKFQDTLGFKSVLLFLVKK